MDSIKYNSKGHSVEFSKRELTIDGKVYSYTGISQIKHSSAYHAYLFRYNGEWVKLFYEEPQGKVIAVLFQRIKKMNERRLSHARATQSIDTSAIAAALEGTEAKAAEPKPEPKPEPAVVEPKPEPEVVEPEVPEIVEPGPTPVVVEPEPAPEVVEPEPAPEVPAEEPKVEEPKAEEAPAEEPKAEEKPEEKPAEKPAEEKPAEEKPVEDAEAAIKKAKRKKAIIIFAIILALFIIAGIIYFLTVGPTTDASMSTDVNETHQYNDIDELIEEMQD